MPKLYDALELFIVNGGKLPAVDNLETYDGQGPVWAANRLGEVVKYDPTDRHYSFPTGSNDQAMLIAA